MKSGPFEVRLWPRQHHLLTILSTVIAGSSTFAIAGATDGKNF
jgi:hypothetical protein